MSEESSVLENKIIWHTINQLLGGAPQELLERILKLPLVEDGYTTLLAKLPSLLRDDPPQDQSIHTMIEAVQTMCVPPYVLNRSNRKIFSDKEKFIRQNIEKLNYSDWSSRDKAQEILRKLHHFYKPEFEKEDVGDESRIGAAILGITEYNRIVLEMALRIACVNRKGDSVRENITGMHPVWLDSETAVVYKPNPFKREGKALSSIQPGWEYAAVVLLRLIAQRIAAFTGLLSLYGLPVASSPRGGFEEHKLTGTVVQVSPIIKGLCFKHFLELREKLRILGKTLKKEDFNEILRDAESDFFSAQQDTQQSFPEIFTPDKEKEQLKVMLNIIKDLSTDNPENLIDIQGDIKRRTGDNQQGVFNEMLISYYKNYGGKIEDIYVFISWIRRFPILMHKRTMEELLSGINSIRLLFKKLRKETAVDILQNIEKMLTPEYLKIEEIWKLVLGLTALLPSDGKTDNFILRIKTNKDSGKVISCWPVSIDNDKSLQMPISREGMEQGVFLASLAAGELLDSEFCKNACSRGIPILIKREKRFSIYGRQKDGEWEEKDLVLSRGEDEILNRANFGISWVKRENIEESLFNILKKGHVLRLCLEIKNILYVIPEFMELEIPSTVRKYILSISAEHLVLNWLCAVACRDSDYEKLIIYGNREDKVDIPVKLSLQVIKFIEKQLGKLHLLLSYSPNIKLGECVEELLPAVWATYQSLQKKHPLPLDFESALYRFFKYGTNTCFLDKQIGMEKFYKSQSDCEAFFENAEKQCASDGKTLFENAEEQCADINAKLITPAEFCLSRLREVNWAILSPKEAWEYVKTFSILPLHVATIDNWRGNTPAAAIKDPKQPWVQYFGKGPGAIQIGDIRALFQYWFYEWAIPQGSPSVAQTMLRLGAQPNYSPLTGKTALHKFCEYCLQYPDVNTAELMVKLLGIQPSCQPESFSTEGPPLFVLVRAALIISVEEWNETKKNIFIMVLNHLTRLGVNFEARHIDYQTVVDELLVNILNSEDLESGHEIKIWLLLELVKRGAGVHVNGALLYRFYLRFFASENENCKQIIGTFMTRDPSPLGWQCTLKSLISTSLSSRNSIWRKRGYDHVAPLKRTIGSEEDLSCKLRIGKRGQGPQSDNLGIAGKEAVKEHGINTSAESIITGETYSLEAIRNNQDLHLVHFNSFEDALMEIAARTFTDLCLGNFTIQGDFIAIPKEHGGYDLGLIYQTTTGKPLRKFLQEKISYCSSRKGSNIIFMHDSAKTYFMSSYIDDVMSHEPPIQLHSALAPESATTLDLDKQELSAHIMMAMILAQYGSTEDYIVIPTGNSDKNILHRIIRIGYQDAFPELFDKEKKEGFCALFFLKAMLEPVYPTVREQLLFISEYSIALLKKWFEQLYIYHKKFQEIFGVNTGLYFKFELIYALLGRIEKIQDQLRRYPTITHLQLLTAIMPSIAGRYSKVFDQHPKQEDVLQRQEEYIKTCSSEQKETLKAEGPNPVFLDHEKVKEVLTGISLEKTRIDSYRGRLEKGAVKVLEEIRSQEMLRNLVNGFFSDESIELRVKDKVIKYIANELEAKFKKKDARKSKSSFIGHKNKDKSEKNSGLNIVFEYLTIQNSGLIDKKFECLLVLSRYLTSLELVHCSKLTINIFNTIEKYCQHLKVMTLEGLSELITICGTDIIGNRGNPPLYLPALEFVNISGNSKLTEIYLKAPRLVSAKFSDNQALATLELDSGAQFLDLDVSHWSRLTDKMLIDVILKSSIKIPRLKIEGTRVESLLLHHISSCNPDLYLTLEIKDLRIQVKRLKRWMKRKEVIINNLSEEKFKNLDLAIEMLNCILKYHPVLAKLKLNKGLVNKRIKNKLLIFLANGIRRHPTMSELHLKAIRLDIELWSVLKLALWDNTVLREVHITLKGLQDSSIESPVFPDLDSFLYCHPGITLIINELNFSEIKVELLKLKENFVDYFAWDLSYSKYSGVKIDSDMLVMCSLLTNDTALVLDFSGTFLSTLNATRLFESLKYNTALQVLNLYNCGLTDDSIRSLLDLLEYNSVLRFVNLDGNPLSEPFKERILKILVKREAEKDLSNTVFRHQSNPISISFQKEPSTELLPYKKVSQSLYYRGDETIISWFTAPAISSVDSFKSQSYYLKLKSSDSKTVCASLLLPGNNTIASASDNTIEIWDLNTGICINTLTEHSGAVTALILFRENVILSASADHTIKIWNWFSGKDRCMGTLKGHNASVTAIIKSSTGYIFSASEDGAVKIWDIDNVLNFPFGSSYPPLGTLSVGNETFARAIIETSDKELVLGCSDGRMIILHLKEIPLEEMKEQKNPDVYTFSADKKGSREAKQKERTLTVYILNGHTAAVLALIKLSLADDKECEALVSGFSDGTINIWERNKGQYNCTHILQTQINPVDDPCVMNFSSQMKIIHVDDLCVMSSPSQISPIEHSNAILSLCPLLSSERAFIMRNSDGLIQIWYLTESGYQNKPLMMMQFASVNTVVQSATGKLVIGSEDGSVKIVSIPSQKSFFDISFAKECGRNIVVTRTECLVRVFFKNPENVEHLPQKLERVRDFLHAFYYNCYARNISLLDIKRTISTEENTVHIHCLDEDLSIQTYDCLSALFQEHHMLQRFLQGVELLTEENLQKAEFSMKSDEDFSSQTYDFLNFLFKKKQLSQAILERIVPLIEGILQRAELSMRNNKDFSIQTYGFLVTLFKKQQLSQRLLQRVEPLVEEFLRRVEFSRQEDENFTLQIYDDLIALLEFLWGAEFSKQKEELLSSSSLSPKAFSNQSSFYYNAAVAQNLSSSSSYVSPFTSLQSEQPVSERKFFSQARFFVAPKESILQSSSSPFFVEPKESILQSSPSPFSVEPKESILQSSSSSFFVAPKESISQRSPSFVKPREPISHSSSSSQSTPYENPFLPPEEPISPSLEKKNF